MNRPLISLLTLCALGATEVLAQAPPPPPPAKPKTLAADLKVFVYPTKGQTPAKQSTDEAKCYTWAVETTGVDPFEVKKQTEAGMQQAAAQEAAAQEARKGARARGAVAGAAGGALIGEIAGNNAGGGAAAGAAVGIIAGGARRRRAKAEGEAQAQATAQATQATAEAKMADRKAFSVCLEGKGYLAKL